MSEEKPSRREVSVKGKKEAAGTGCVPVKHVTRGRDRRWATLILHA